MANELTIPGVTLTEDEQVIFVEHPHWITYWSVGKCLGYLLTLGILFIWERIKRKNEIYALTNYRFISESGVISKVQRNVEIEKIQDVQFRIIGLFQRMLDAGSVHIETAGETSSIDLPIVHDPRRICDLLQQEIVAAKKREVVEMVHAIKEDA